MTLDERRRLGWQRNALQALYFGPSNLLDPEESWRSITDRLIVAPVVSTLVYENIPREVNEWARRVGEVEVRQDRPVSLRRAHPSGTEGMERGVWVFAVVAAGRGEGKRGCVLSRRGHGAAARSGGFLQGIRRDLHRRESPEVRANQHAGAVTTSTRRL